MWMREDNKNIESHLGACFTSSLLNDIFLRRRSCIFSLFFEFNPPHLWKYSAHLHTHTHIRFVIYEKKRIRRTNEWAHHKWVCRLCFSMATDRNWCLNITTSRWWCSIFFFVTISNIFLLALCALLLLLSRNTL